MARKPKTTNGDTPTVKKATRPDKFTTEQMINALTTTKGMKTLAARQLGCDYKTVVRYINEYPEVAEACELAHEHMLDSIELKAYDRCMKDDTTMIIFMLKTQGKQRGYVERSEHTGADGGPIQTETKVTVFSDMSDEELDGILARNPTSERGKGETDTSA